MLSQAATSQPWDRPGWRPADADRATAIIERKRADVLADTLGHYPAPLAILDCVSRGLPQPFDDAIRTEMQIFSKLIQRREPRNMIRTLFLGRLDHDRLRKAGGIPAPVEQAVAAIKADHGIKEGVNTYKGQITYAAVADSQKKPFKDVLTMV